MKQERLRNGNCAIRAGSNGWNDIGCSRYADCLSSGIPRSNPNGSGDGTLSFYHSIDSICDNY